MLPVLQWIVEWICAKKSCNFCFITYFSFSIRLLPNISLGLFHHCKISDATQSVLPRHQTLPCDQTAPVTNPVYELPFTHHQRSFAHHIDSSTTLTVARHPQTTIPIIHCTDDTLTADCTSHTPYLKHGLPQSER